MLGTEGEVHEQMIEKWVSNPLTWGHIHARIVFPKDVKELMTTLTLSSSAFEKGRKVWGGGRLAPQSGNQ